MIPIEQIKEILVDEALSEKEAEEFRDACYALVRAILDHWTYKILNPERGQSIHGNEVVVKHIPSLPYDLSSTINNGTAEISSD